MTGPSWLMDSKRIATKIKSASGTTDPSRCKWLSNPTKACPRCNHIIDNSDVLQEWPGLPQGVKFDPSDSELLWHLQAKVAKGDTNPHPFINEFIPTVDEEDGICYTHPQKLPGVKKDGSVSHFFHKTFKAYNTGTRKRRKIHTDELGGDVRWHKTGKTKQVIVDGIHVGCKKIMVLYMNKVKGDKPEKTNWVMHQYHLGTEEDEKDSEFVVSKIFYQQQLKPGDNRSGEDLSTIMETMDVAPVTQLINATMHYDSPTSTLPHQIANQHPEEIPDLEITDHEMTSNKKFNGCRNSEEVDDKDGHPTNEWWDGESLVRGDHEMTSNENFSDHRSSEEKIDDKDGHPPNEEDAKWWDGESQFLLDSQQLAEGIALCDEFLRSQSQSSYGAGGSDYKDKRSRPSLSDYARAGGVDDLKKDLEECQNLNLGCFVDPDTNIEQLDTHPDMRLSQLEFGSQDSFQFPA